MDGRVRDRCFHLPHLLRRPQIGGAMTGEDLKSTGFNPAFITMVLIFDYWIWFVREMQRVENAMNRYEEPK